MQVGLYQTKFGNAKDRFSHNAAHTYNGLHLKFQNDSEKEEEIYIFFLKKVQANITVCSSLKVKISCKCCGI